MTVGMNLEVESGVSIDEILKVLLNMEAVFAQEESRLVGNFKCSGCYFVFWYQDPPSDIVAEGVSQDWKVGLEGVFSSRISYLAESWEDIKGFLGRLTQLTTSRFVLSFQYESLYAVGDGVGLKILKNMVED